MGQRLAVRTVLPVAPRGRSETAAQEARSAQGCRSPGASWPEPPYGVPSANAQRTARVLVPARRRALESVSTCAQAGEGGGCVECIHVKHAAHRVWSLSLVFAPLTSSAVARGSFMAVDTLMSMQQGCVRHSGFWHDRGTGRQDSSFGWLFSLSSPCAHATLKRLSSTDCSDAACMLQFAVEVAAKKKGNAG